MQKKVKSFVGLQIRHAVVGLLYRAPLRETALPSASELAKEHDVSMSTVNRELKKLVEDGLIVGRRGVGMFTVPGAIKFNKKDVGRRLIGIIYGDGRFLFYGLMEWHLISCCGFALMPGMANVRPVSLISSHPDDVVAELKSLNLDGFIVIDPNSSLRKALQILRNDGCPVVSIGQRVERVPSILFDHHRAGRDMGALLLERNVRSVLWMSYDSTCREHLAGARHHFAEARAKVQITEVANMGECEVVVEEYAKNKKFPDAIYAHGETTYSLRGIAEADWLMLSETGVSQHVANFHGIVRDYPWQELSDQMASCFTAMFDGKEVSEEYLLQFPISGQFFTEDRGARKMWENQPKAPQVNLHTIQG